jgi:hypothetical protein
MLIFVSYAHADRHRAAEVKSILEDVGISSFMAHEDIGVSKVWRDEIMKNLQSCDAVVCLFSENFYASPWCLQESGIASYRHEHEGIGLILLSIDGKVSPGCMNHLQSPKVKGTEISWADLAPGFATFMVESDLNDILIAWAGKAFSYRDAESRLRTLVPHLPNMTLAQVEELLRLSHENGQIWDAAGCLKTYLPAIIKRYDDLNGSSPDTKSAEFIRDKTRKWV